MPVFEDGSLSVGRTPLVRLNRVGGGAAATILAKIEGRNPAFSVKDRIGASMVWDAERRGVLKPGKALIEPTSGNTGIALAFVAAARGYPITLTMPETMSLERRKVVEYLGAKLVLTSGSEGMAGSIAKAEEIVASDPERYVMLQQFRNPANPEIHVRTTGPEIWDDTGGAVDVLVSGIGTGGTISGISRYFKKVRGRKILSVGVEPFGESGDYAAPGRAAAEAGAAPHSGDRSRFHPGHAGPGNVGPRGVGDRRRSHGNGAAAAPGGGHPDRHLFRRRGGGGGAAGPAARVFRQDIVVILPDAAERYLSTALFEG